MTKSRFIFLSYKFITKLKVIQAHCHHVTKLCPSYLNVIPSDLFMLNLFQVRPVALIPSSIDPKVPQILINREPLSHLTPDVELLGDCDGIINEICLR